MAVCSPLSTVMLAYYLNCIPVSWLLFFLFLCYSSSMVIVFSMPNYEIGYHYPYLIVFWKWHLINYHCSACQVKSPPRQYYWLLGKFKPGKVNVLYINLVTLLLCDWSPNGTILEVIWTTFSDIVLWSPEPKKKKKTF